jgi:hypothetical protein
VALTLLVIACIFHTGWCRMSSRRIVWGSLGACVIAFIVWTWTLPGLRTTPTGTSVAGCGNPRDENAARLCQQLFCWKALREHPEIHDRAEVSLEQSFFSADGLDSIHVGKAHWDGSNGAEQKVVRCLMQGDAVVRAGPITSDEFNRIVYTGERL